MDQRDSIRKYLAEGIGTFAMMFCGTGAIIIDQQTHGTIGHLGVAITFGLVVMCMIYALGEISGAHFNPAVTIAFGIAGRLDRRDIPWYIVSQLVGAVLASVALHILFPSDLLLGATLPAGSDWQSWVLELILTFLLMLVILHVSQGSHEQGMFAGIAIGATVLLAALWAGPISGASMNPARSLAPALVSGHLAHLWIYITAPILGAAAAVGAWRVLLRGVGE
jgi:aquaporin NIP